jgi:predicted Zn-dependent peptidase
VKRAAIALVLFAAACADAPPPPPSAPVAAPSSTPTAQPSVSAREAPPPSGPPIAFHLPEARWSSLANGASLGIAVVRGLPIVEARVAIRGGRAAEGDRPGVAEVLAEVLKDAADPSALGGQLAVEAGDDAIELRLSVTTDVLAPALAKIGAALRAPKMAEADVAKITKRLAGDAADRAAEDGEANAEQALRRALFPAGSHPYAAVGALPEDFAKIRAADAARFHARTFAAPSATVMLAGDLDPEAARAAVEKALAGMRAKAEPLPALPQVAPPAARRIVIAHRAKAERGEIYVGYLAPKPSDAEADTFELMAAVLGYKGTGRLFVSVRETQSLVYRIRSRVDELERAPAIGAIYASTQAPKTARAVEAILAEIQRIAREAPSAAEVEGARSVLAGALASRVSRVGDIAGELLRLRRFGLPADRHERRDRALASVSPEAVRAAAERWMRPGHEVIAVAGDADVIAEDLRRLGPVEIVDPARGFALVKRLDARAP